MTPEDQWQEPSFPRPWYYRPEYMIPMFVFWPSGALLTLRSPWNNNVLIGGVAWAFMIVGAVMGFRWIREEAYQPIALFYIPGVLLTLLTQVQWAVFRRQMSGDPPVLEENGEERKRPRPSARRRRRSPRDGRTKG